MGVRTEAYKDRGKYITVLTYFNTEHSNARIRSQSWIGHYLITDAPVSDNPWVTRSVMYYDMDPHSKDIMIPTYVDIKMVELLYKEDGFGGNTSHSIKAGYYTTGDDEICTFKCSFSRVR